MPLQLTREDFMTPEQVRRLKGVLRRAAAEAVKTGKKGPVRDWAILHVALDAGLRVSEILALRVGDLILDPGHAAIIVRCGKGGKKRGVDIGQALREHLSEYLDWKRAVGEPTHPEALLFPSPRGGALTRQAVYHMFKRYARLAGLPQRFTIHSCRHTYASMLYKASRYNLRLVQKQLGHASIRTTQVYADVLSADALEAVNGLPQ
ncbi:TPA: phage integrase family protein [Candidatus Bipolaricaulota bacterium]|nr:phage integrase family protein [Candidatus Bipolaricaulota bacterium]